MFFGAAFTPHTQTRFNAVNTLLGPVSVVRGFHSGFPATYGAAGEWAWHNAAGVKGLLSFKPDPEDVIAGTLDSQLRTLAASIPNGSYVTAWHEPENDAALLGGAFVDMLQRVYSEMKSANPTLQIGYAAMAYQWGPSQSSTSNPANWTPVKDFCDWVGVDVYSYAWQNPDANLGNHVDFQRWYDNFGDHPVRIIAERGVSQYSTGPSRVDVIEADIAWAKANGIAGYMYWNAAASAGVDPADTTWVVDSDPDAAALLKAEGTAAGSMVTFHKQTVLQSTTAAAQFTVNHTSTAGRALVALVALRASSASSVTGITDSAGNAWVFGGMGRHPTGSARIELWYTLNAAAVTNITVTQEASVKYAVNVSEWSGLRNSAAFDSGVDDSGSAVTVLDSGNLTTVANNTLVLGAVASTTTGTRTFNTTTGFTQLQAFASQDTTANVIASAAYRVTSASGTYHAMWNEDAGRNYGGITVALRDASEGAGSAPTTVSLYHHPVTVGSDTLQARYYSTAPLTATDPSVTRLYVMHHGVSRNADDYCQYAIDATKLAGELGVTRVIAPHFITDEDLTSDDGETIYWDGDWDRGDRSLDATPYARPFIISSFEIDDRLIAQAVASFPNLQRVVFCGNSAGGQFMNRYAASNALPETYPDISFRWCVMAPSSYLYFNARRYQDDTDQMGTLSSSEQSACPDWNDYKWGLVGLNNYMAAAGDLAAKYQVRDVHHFCGGADNDPNDTSLDVRCPSMWQGSQRVERMQRYALHLQDVYGSNPHPFTVVPGIEHQASQMVLSDELQAALFTDTGGPTPPAFSGGSTATVNASALGAGAAVIGAITLVGQKILESTAGATQFTITYASLTGHTLVALVALRASTGSAVTAVTDDAGNTWVFGGMGRHPTASARIELWYALNAVSVSSITVTQQAVEKYAVHVSEWTGLRSTDAFDSGVDVSGSLVTLLDSGQLTTLTADTLVIGAVAASTTGTDSRVHDTTTGFTELTSPFRSTGGSDVIASAAYRVVSAIGTYHALWTETAGTAGGRNYGGITVALRKATVVEFHSGGSTARVDAIATGAGTGPSAAVTLRGQTTQESSSGATQFTVSHTSTAGHALIALIALRASSASSVSSVSDDASNNWQFGAMGRHPTGSARIEMWYTLNANAVTQVTVNQTGSVKYAVNITEWSAIGAVDALGAVVDVSGSAVTVLDSGELTTAVANALVIGAVASTTTGVRTFDASTGFTQLTSFRSNDTTANVIASAAYRVAAATGTYHSIWNEDAGRNYGGITVTLRAAGEPTLPEHSGGALARVNVTALGGAAVHNSGGATARVTAAAIGGGAVPGEPEEHAGGSLARVTALATGGGALSAIGFFATLFPDEGRVFITLTWTEPPVPRTVRIDRVDEHGNVVPVRNAEPGTLLGGTWAGDDYEAPLDTWFHYRASSTDAPGVYLATNHVFLPSNDQSWLKHPGLPALNMPVTVVRGPDLSRPIEQGIFEIEGRRDPVAVTMTRSSARGDLQLRTDTDAERGQLTALLETGSPLLFQAPAGYGVGSIYIAVGEAEEARWLPEYGPDPVRLWTLPFTVVGRPVGTALPTGNTWSDVLGAYPDWAQMEITEGTWLGLLRGLGTTGDPPPPAVGGEVDLSSVGAVP